MSTSVLTYDKRGAQWLARAVDYWELAKPRIALLELVTVAVGAYLAAWGNPNPVLLAHALLGTALVAAGASAHNQLIEKQIDARMARTASRPLPSGRIGNLDALVAGCISSVVGVVYLAVAVGGVTACLAAATWVLYVLVYTPLKSRTCMNTVVGAVAGALPILIGWSVSGDVLTLEAAAVFLIIYLWQFPHFMAIAWLYRDEYSQAGLQMLPNVDARGQRSGRLAVFTALWLVPVSLLPALLGMADAVYFAAAILLGAAYIHASARFWLRLDKPSARRLLTTSLWYLPGLLGLMILTPLF